MNLIGTHCDEFVVGLVQLVDRPVGVPVDAVKAELIDADGAVTCVMYQNELSIK